MRGAADDRRVRSHNFHRICIEQSDFKLHHILVMKLPSVKFYSFLCFAAKLFAVTCHEGIQEEVKYVRMRLDQFNSEFKEMWWLHQSADWNYCINITSATDEARAFASETYSEWMKNWKLWARGIDTGLLPNSIKDNVDIIASGIVIMDADEARLISQLRSKMTKIYSSATLSIPELNISARGEEEYGSLMVKFRDPVLLQNIWKSWRMQVGEKTRTSFLKLINLLNKAAHENDFENLGSAWRSELGLEDVALSLWDEVKPFYAQLHAYVLHKLKHFYGSKFFKSNTFIPAHLLGSLWGENWVALNDVLSPYPELLSLNITADFVSKNFSVRDLVKKAEDFYITAGLGPMEASFWELSMFEKPRDGRLVDCHAASYDFALKRDFRIRMCGEVKEQSFMEAIHEMGHVQYYMAYHHLPMLYRSGANSAFHEAVGETMVYAAQSPQCLDLMKIVKSPTLSREMLTNTLMKQALSKFVLLPWALTVEIWRYMLLSGNITNENMNKKWWELRKRFQGIEPPNDECAKLFDAGTKYHIINNIPYMRYFISRFLEHQFLESLCDDAGDNIHSCCFIKSKTAGENLKKMLSFGSSESWPDALKSLTRRSELSAKPLLEYYGPLYLWLVNYNKHHNIPITL